MRTVPLKGQPATVIQVEAVAVIRLRWYEINAIFQGALQSHGLWGQEVTKPGGFLWDLMVKSMTGGNLANTFETRWTLVDLRNACQILGEHNSDVKEMMTKAIACIVECEQGTAGPV